MMGIGLSEIALIGLLSLILFGPKESLRYIKKIAKGIQKVLKYRNEFESTLRKSMDE